MSARREQLERALSPHEPSSFTSTELLELLEQLIEQACTAAAAGDEVGVRGARSAITLALVIIGRRLA